MQKIKILFFTALYSMMIYSILPAQTLTQTLRGQVLDKQLQTPVEMATIQITGTSMACRSDSLGRFRIEKLPVGEISIQVSCIGYQTLWMEALRLQSGKELVLTLELEPSIQKAREVIITGKPANNNALNELSAVSTRSFRIEETQRYAAAVNDPSRMATHFAGVMSADDGNNQLIIRGNAPAGILWRMNGLDIPNPNHFAAAGSSGGGISILSAQMLGTSDFSTGAFTPEYGNALSGVFDLHLRKGNEEKREYTLQAGLLGLNTALEGPIKKGHRGSYLVNYRYSTLGILSALGLKFGGTSTLFQDLSWHCFWPTKRWGSFSFFGFGGLSTQQFKAETDSNHWKSELDRYGSRFSSSTGFIGFKHVLPLGKSMVWTQSLGSSLTDIRYDRHYVRPTQQNLPMYQSQYGVYRLQSHSMLSKRFASGLYAKAGLLVSGLRMKLREEQRIAWSPWMEKPLDTIANTALLQSYVTMQYALNEQWKFQLGWHALYLQLSQRWRVEPRASVRFTPHKRHEFAIAYGQHAQTQGYATYLTRITDSLQQVSLPNQSLDFTRAHHMVLSHRVRLATGTFLKTEVYYQQLYRVPVGVHAGSTFSVLNTQGDYVREALVNRGKGRNYGVECSVERPWRNHYYLMLNTSLYRSQYTADDKTWYHTRYDGGYLLNLSTGKEFVSKKAARTLGIHMRALLAGGYRYTPIDTLQSQQQHEMIYHHHLAYSKQLPAYYRCDLRVSISWQRKRFNSTLSLDIQNATNHLNVYDRVFEVETGEVKTYYQTGIIPVLNYIIEFNRRKPAASLQP